LDSVSSVVNALYYARIVREKYPLRRLIIACGDICEKAYNQFDTVEELDIPVILLSQLNRALADRSNFMSRLTDLSESGSVEQDADFVLLLHHEDYYHKGRTGYRNTNVADVIIAKQCNGPTGTIKLTFHPEMSRFECCAMADAVIF
jgi:replicative DNA helicase